nr:unnamed protein product [Spirometra erinaceieuropaei]
MTGLAFLLVFTAFGTASQANESVLEGARNESGGTFSASGYTSPKFGMFGGSLAYVIFLASFFKPITWIIYCSSIILGVGAAVLWTAQGVFITNCSKTDELHRNFGVFWMLFQFSGVIGNLYTYLHLSNVESITADVRIPMYAVLTTVCALGSLVLLLLPQPRQVTGEINVSGDRASDPNETSNILESSGNRPSASSVSCDSPEEPVKSSPPQAPTIRSIIARSVALSRTPTMLAILAATAFTGLNQTFYSGVIGTCLSRMQQFGKSAKSYIGLSGIFIGLGEIIGSQITLLGNTIRPGGVMCIGFAAALVGQLMAFLMIPSGAPVESTSEIAFIQPTVYVAMLTAFLLGVVDSVWNTQISALIGRIYPDASQNTAAAFALYKFVQSVTSAVAFFYSPHLLLHWQLLALAATATLGAFCFIVVERRWRRRLPPVV